VSTMVNVIQTLRQGLPGCRSRRRARVPGEPRTARR
jgi:hypothetical protein